jgi:hypothetical protein
MQFLLAPAMLYMVLAIVSAISNSLLILSFKLIAKNRAQFKAAMECNFVKLGALSMQI